LKLPLTDLAKPVRAVDTITASRKLHPRNPTG
jgi:hypothetical protein